MFNIFTRFFFKSYAGAITYSIVSYIRVRRKKLYVSTLAGAVALYPIAKGLIIPETQCFLKSDYNLCDLLCRCSKNGSKAELARIIKKGADVNCRHSLGWCPLHSAAANGNVEIARELIENGADVNALDEFSGILKVSARAHLHPVNVAETRANDFGKNFSVSTDFTGFTPIHYAVFLQNSEMIRLLLNAGADITITNSFGETACDLALTEDIKSLVLTEYEKALEVKKQREREERKKYPLENRLKEFIVGQEEAINTVSSTIRRRESGWIRGDKPLVLLFLGSSGVGKTELAKQLANYMFKNDKKGFIRVDMSEYQNQHEVSKFIGAPPGYVGHEQGGQLTSNLKACPNAIVLFDEIEKAHPDIITIMLQLFDEGRLTDGQGNTINCPNAIFIMTSNLASEEIAKYATKLRLQKPESNSENVTVSKQFKDNVMYPILKTHFKRDEFLGRITDMVYFLPFTKNELRKLVDIELNFWSKQAYNIHKIKLTWEPDLLNILSDGYDIHYGARSLKHEVEKKLVNKIASLHDEGKIVRNSTLHISVDYGSEKFPLENPEISFDIKTGSWFNL